MSVTLCTVTTMNDKGNSIYHLSSLIRLMMLQQTFLHLPFFLTYITWPSLCSSTSFNNSIVFGSFVCHSVWSAKIQVQSHELSKFQSVSLGVGWFLINTKGCQPLVSQIHVCAVCQYLYFRGYRHLTLISSNVIPDLLLFICL